MAGQLVQALGALVLALALAWAGARLLRGSPLATRTGKRLAVEEALALDARRRLLLLRVDGRELLVMTGGGEDHVIGWLPEGGPR